MTNRVYDKGENRHKHRGRHDDARIVLEHGNRVGKCPRGFSLGVARELLKTAIEEYKGRQPDIPFRLWAYHDGAVYAARTSDGGTTWHGYPNQEPPQKILAQLEQQADARNEKNRLRQWLNKRF